MRSLSKQKQKTAQNLLHLLFVNKLRYNEKWECWTGYVINSEDVWGEVPYEQLANIAALITSGLTKKRASIEETKVLLQQIFEYPVWVAYHPAYLLRQPQLSPHSPKWETWQVLCRVKLYLNGLRLESSDK